MNDPLPLFMQWPYSVLFGAFMLLTASALLARMAGWASLAERFRTQDDYEGERFSFKSASMGRRWWPVMKDRWPQIRLYGSTANAVIKAHAAYIKSRA